MRLRIPALLLGAFALTMTLTTGQHPAVASTTKPSRTAAVVEYLVHVKTGTFQGAGTDANVWLQVWGEKSRTAFIPLETERDDFERSSVDTFAFATNELGPIRWLCLYADDAGLFPDWWVEWVDIGVLVPGTNRIVGPRYAAAFNLKMPVKTRVCRRASVS